MNLLASDKKLYEAVVKLNMSNIVPILTKSLQKKYNNVIVEEDNDYIIAVGDIPIALVAHMDTVFQTPPANIYYDQEAEIVWSPTGGIGDDRVGIFLIMKLLQQTKLRPYIFLINDGCKFLASTIIYFLPYARKEEEAKNKLIYTSVPLPEKLASFAAGILPIVLFCPNDFFLPLLMGIVGAIIICALLFLKMKAKIKGYTGDCCGATFILAEVVCYVIMTFHTLP